MTVLPSIFPQLTTLPSLYEYMFLVVRASTDFNLRPIDCNTQIADPNRATIFYSRIGEIERVRFVAFDLWIWNSFLCFCSLSPLISGTQYNFFRNSLFVVLYYQF
ncbi:hypothetical protein RchiOBHm_Chr1g0375331 [Rosa chinensis]|uniref:Uncharacterized protein n=1 Tax=Rosa chinensis TaxID=74649 RepID=A0A2P6SMK3_ROSCH|nr:hypothetical protein RchiOBHm_Chr1g0375331 [Rosa chinensis]